MLTAQKNISQIDSIILASYIAHQYGKMSHLKLQKLLYYLQAYHLAYFDQSLVQDKFEAWVHGPVSRKLYANLADKSILYSELVYTLDPGERNPAEVVKELLTSEQFECVTDVLTEYSKLTGPELENLTHNELPWIEARKGCAPGDKCTNTINEETMKSYYKEQLYGKASS